MISSEHLQICSSTATKDSKSNRIQIKRQLLQYQQTVTMQQI